MELVGIIPIRPIATRTHRLQSVSVSMDIRRLLDVYFDTKPELASQKEALLEKTLSLMEADEGEEQSA